MKLRPHHSHILVALVALTAALPDAGESQRSVEYKLARVRAVGHACPFKEGDLVALDPDLRPVMAGTEKNEQGETVPLALVSLEAILATVEA